MHWYKLLGLDSITDSKDIRTAGKYDEGFATAHSLSICQPSLHQQFHPCTSQSSIHTNFQFPRPLATPPSHFFPFTTIPKASLSSLLST